MSRNTEHHRKYDKFDGEDKSNQPRSKEKEEEKEECRKKKRQIAEGSDRWKKGKSEVNRN